MTRVKICGITNLEDAMTAVDCGADALGFIFTSSKRQIHPQKAKDIVRQLKPFITTVGVFMDESLKNVDEIADFTGVDVIQLHGSESTEYCQKMKRRIVKRIRVQAEDTTENLIQKIRPYSVSAFLLDPGAGTGKTFDWEIAKPIGSPLILAGGLNPENVRKAVQIVKPYGVDVSSGVEISPGKKDPDKIRRFIEEVG